MIVQCDNCQKNFKKVLYCCSNCRVQAFRKRERETQSIEIKIITPKEEPELTYEEEIW